MLSHEYETIFILRPDLDEAGVNTVMTKFETVISENGGQLLDRDDWGNKKLAYPIAKHVKGHFVREHFVAPSELILELERKIRIDDSAIRFMTIRLSDSVDIDAALEAAGKVRAAREEQRRKEAEAEARRAAEIEAQAQAQAASATAAAAAAAAAAEASANAPAAESN